MNETIEFANVDEIVELIDARFANANVQQFESSRDAMIQSFTQQFAMNAMFTNSNVMRFDVDVLNTMIEMNLRLNIATHYAYEYATKNNREFDNIFAIAIHENKYNSLYAIVEISNIDNEHEYIDTIATIHIDENLKIRKQTHK